MTYSKKTRYWEMKSVPQKDCIELHYFSNITGRYHKTKKQYTQLLTENAPVF